MIDLTEGIQLHSTIIEETVSRSPPQFIDVKDASVELAFGFPNMAYGLWSYLIAFRRFPTQLDFLHYYMKIHAETLKAFDKTAVEARVLRAFPSLTREIHFYSLARESSIFTSVSYSAQLDVELGVDLRVGLGGRLYNIACLTATKRALNFRTLKRNQRHKEQPNTLEMILDLKTGRNINGWLFFDLSHVKTLEIDIINYAWNHYGQHPLDLIG